MISETEPLAVPDIDLDKLGQLLLKVESHVHRSGWDQPVQVRVIYDHGADGGATDRVFRRITPPEYEVAPVRHGPYTATTLFGPRILYHISGAPVWQQLRTLVMAIAFPGPLDDGRVIDGVSPVWDNVKLIKFIEMMHEMLRQPGMVGFCAVAEAWKNSAPPGGYEGSPLQQALHGKVNLGDVPTSVETRMVYCVDLADRVHHVGRDRGKKPGLAVDVGMRGDLTTSMRILADVATGRTPPLDKFDEHYPTLRKVMEDGGKLGKVREVKRPTPEDP